MASAILLITASARLLAIRGGADINYPIPPNPFAPSDATPPPAEAPLAPAPKDSGATAEQPGDWPPSADGAAAQPVAAAAAAAPPPPPRAKRLRWQPALCVGVIGAACRLSRPADTALLAALDAFHQGGAGASLAAGARDAAAEVSAGPLFHHAVHSGVLWVGLLGQWLPLAPLSLALLRPWASALSAAQILSYGCLFGYLMRRILPGNPPYAEKTPRQDTRTAHGQCRDTHTIRPHDTWRSASRSQKSP